MKVNVLTPIQNLKGEIIKDGENDYLLRDVLINAILADKSGLKGVEKLKRYNLADKINKTDVVEIEDSYIDELLEDIAAQYATLVYGFVHGVLKKDGPQ